VPNSDYLKDSFFWTLDFARATLDALVHVDDGVAIDHGYGFGGTDFNARLAPTAPINIYLEHLKPSSLSDTVPAIVGRHVPA
jgi:hypothetical protein